MGQTEPCAYPCAIIGVDPGSTTGVAVYTVKDAKSPAKLVETTQLADPDTVPNDIMAIAMTYDTQGYYFKFVIEQFDKRPGVASPDMTPYYIIRSITKMIAGNAIHWQTPSQAKNLVKPAKTGKPDGLRRFGWYVVGQRHANDASRHVIVYLVEKLKHMPTIEKGWPRRG